MSASKSTGKGTTGLRFASLIRVSTDRQAKQGQSLITQRDGNARDVERLGGSIVAHYGGQEHATPGHERRELDRLIADVDSGIFDAVIVAYADRWSRDNRKSKQGTDAFLAAGIRFFIGTMELDLTNPAHLFILGINAEVNEFVAAQQVKKTLESKMSRAKSGLPACGRLPYGRTYSKQVGWGLDPDKHALIKEAARRYLAGEMLTHIADSMGWFLSHLYKVLFLRAGSVWVQEFRSKKLGIVERVETAVPPLLDDATIQAIKDRAQANQTVLRGSVRHKHLLANVLICGTCGSTLFGTRNSKGVRVYRHYPRRKLAMWRRSCGEIGMHIKADALEESVMRSLFSLFGNAARVQQAVENAIPDKQKQDDTRQQLERLVGEQRRIEVKKGKVVRAISLEIIKDEEAAREMAELRRQGDAVAEQVNKLKALLANTPTRDQIETTAARIVDLFGRRHVDNKKLIEDRIREDQIMFDFDGMTWDERKALLGLVFNGTTPEGQRLGIYVSRAVGQVRKRCQVWNLRILGRLVDQLVMTPSPAWEPREEDDQEFAGAPLQDELLDESVTGFPPQRRRRQPPGGPAPTRSGPRGPARPPRGPARPRPGARVAGGGARGPCRAGA
jgi:site-specific DNA recombinase